MTALVFHGITGHCTSDDVGLSIQGQSFTERSISSTMKEVHLRFLADYYLDSQDGYRQIFTIGRVQSIPPLCQKQGEQGDEVFPS